MNHALTTFNNVRIPASSLLGSLEKPTNPRVALTHSIWRVSCGTMAFGYLTLSMMKAFATIGTMYSLRRHVGGPKDRVPVMHFRTQQAPILTLTAQIYVMDAFVRSCTKLFQDTSVDYRVRHAVAGIAKATIVGHAYAGGLAVSERCGAQGLFAHNQMTTLLVSVLHLDLGSRTQILHRMSCEASPSPKETFLSSQSVSVDV